MADIRIFPDAPEGTPPSRFVHLHVHSDYSLLDGASKLDTLIARAKALNMKALALTDHGNMFGVLNFEHICRANGIRPIVGCEFYVAENDRAAKENTKYGGWYYHLILLCKNVEGYKNMSWLSSLAFKEGLFHGKPCIDFGLLQKHHEGLVCLSACIQGQLPQELLHGDDAAAEETALKYDALFGRGNFFIELQDHGLEDQRKVAPRLVALSRKTGIPLALTNDVHYCMKEDAEAQEVLQCIGFKKTLAEPHRSMGGGLAEWYLKSEAEMRSLFPDIPEAADNTLKIAEMCDMEIPQYKTQQLKDCLPRFEFPKTFPTQNAYVLHLVEQGLRKRYKTITKETTGRAMYELNIIFDMGFSGYFLVVWEFIHWAKERGMPIGPGRGSGAGSLVAYAMEITDIDPFRFNLIFERFLNPERVSMPDFDVDMDYDYRQDIIAHTRELYGDDQVGHIVTFGTLKAKAVIADVGRVLGIPISEVNILKKCIPDNPKARLSDAFAPPDKDHPDNGQLIQYKDEERYKKLFELSFKLENVNRNTSLHASGMVISLSPLPDWAPVFKDTKTGEVGVQYTMDVIEPCGLVKMDYLGLKTLSLIRYAEDIINRHLKPGEKKVRAEDADETDSETFDLFDRGDTMAVFQFESPGMQKILRQAKPRRLEEIVALNALYRPGPMDYIPQYIEGKRKPETVRYPDECLKDILEETYGVMVYQEQVMQVAQRVAGFSLGEADMLRRAMGKKKAEVLMGKKQEFIDGAIKNGFTEKRAAEIFEIMVPFAGYGFNKSHAAAYSVVAYRTAWLKCHYPAEFMAANLTNEITSTDGLPLYIAEARRMGIQVDAPDINRSDTTFDVVDGRIVFGLKGIKGMGEAVSAVIVKERRENGPFKSFIDFLERCIPIHDDNDKSYFTTKTVEVLIKTGAFDALGLNRPTMLSNMEAAMEYAEKKFADGRNGQEDLFGGTGESTYSEFSFKPMEDLPRMEKLNQEKELVGIYVSGHPLDEYKSAIQNAVTLTSQTIEREGRTVEAEKKSMAQAGASQWQLRGAGRTLVALGSVGGIHEIRTKKGDEMAFAKLSDYFGEIDLTFFTKEWAEMKGKIHEDGIYAFKGKVDASRETPSFVVNSMEDPNSLQAKSITEVHIQLDPSFDSEKEVEPLKDFLCARTGRRSVFFHVDVAGRTRIVKANPQLLIQSDDKTLDALRDIPLVKEVWTS